MQTTPGKKKGCGVIIAIIILIILLILWWLSQQPDDGGGTAQGKIVFVSSQLYNGNFGNGQRVLGHLNADQKCQDLASAAGLSGSFKAWISGREGSGHGAADRLAHASEPYVLVNGTKVADDWADLTDGSLDHAIDRTELDTPVGDQPRVWTNTTTSGQAWDNSRQCAIGPNPDIPGLWTWSCGAPSWTAGDCQFQSGKYGLATSTTGTWTGATSSNINCENLYHLYCMQQ